MASFENVQGITRITFNHRTNNWCPLGNDYYTNQFTVSFTPGKVIPDYVEIQEDVGKRINHQPLSLEDAVSIMFDIVNVYDPKELIVKSYGDDAVHFPVEVVKEK